MNRIKELRKQKGIGQKELAKSLGVTQQTISLYEKDSREPKLATWEKLADFFGVSVPYLQGISKYRDYESNAQSFKDDLYKSIMDNLSFFYAENGKKVPAKVLNQQLKHGVASIFVEKFVNIFDATIKNVDMGTLLKDRYIALAKKVKDINDLNEINAIVTRGLMLALEAQIDPDARQRIKKIHKIIFDYKFEDSESVKLKK